MRWFKFFLLMIIVLSLPDCGNKKLPFYLVNPDRHFNFPPEQFITAVGVSRDNRMEAFFKAKQIILDKINNSITLSMNSLEKSEIHSTNIDADNFSYKELFLRVKESMIFEKEQMIQADNESSGQFNGSYYVFAYLPRNSILENYYKIYDEKEELFQKTSVEIDEAYKVVDYPLFRSKLDVLKSHMADLVMYNIKINSILYNSIFEKFVADERLFYELIQLASVWKNNTKLYYTVAGNFQQQKIPFWTDFFKKILKEIGFEAEHASECQTNQNFDYFNHFEIEERCKEGYIGYLCEFKIQGYINTCTNKKELLKFDFPWLLFKGTQSERRSIALENGYKALNSDIVKKMVEEKFLPYFPVK